MRNFRNLVMMALAVIMAALLVAPSGALAATMIKDDDFTDGVYTIDAGGTYILDAAGAKSIVVACSDSSDEVVLDLYGNTLTGSGSRPVVTVAGSSTVTVKNGSLECGDATCVEASGSNVRVTLQSITAKSGICAVTAVDGATVEIESGDYGISPALAVGATVDSHVRITGGTFKSAVGAPSTTVLEVEGGSFADDGFIEFVTSGHVVLKTKGGLYDVTTAAEVLKSDAAYAVECGSRPTVYFEDESQANAYKDACSGTSHVAKVTVEFDANGGTPSTTKTILWGDTVSAPDTNPTSSEGFFASWQYDGEDFDFGIAIEQDTKLVAKWNPPVARVDGTIYASLQEAINDCPGGGVVELLKDTDEKVLLSMSSSWFTSKDITLDLDGHTLSSSDGIPVTVTAGGNITIKNGAISGHREGVYVSSYIYTPVTVLLQDVNASSDILQAVSISSGTVTIDGGTYKNAKSSTFATLRVGGGNVTIKDGEFVAKSGLSCVRYEGGSLTVEGGDFSDSVALVGGVDDLTITGGAFGDPSNAAYVDGNYAMYLSASNPGRYQVLEAAKARLEADWGVTANGYAVYFDNKSDAQAYAEACKDEQGNAPAVYKLHMTVSYKYKNEVISTKHVEYGDAIGDFEGTLPKAPGYEFAGWAVKLSNGTYDAIDSSYEPTDDLVLYSLWLKTGSDDSGDATVNPAEDGSSFESTATPQTGDPAGIALAVAAFGGALVGVGAHRRRS